MEIKVSLDDLRAVVTSMVANERVDKILEKPQLTFTEACELYGSTRIRKYIKSGLLKPSCQNGRGSAKYYSHKKITDLVNKSFFNQKNVKL